MASKKTSGIDIFDTRSRLSSLMDAATGDPAPVPQEQAAVQQVDVRETDLSPAQTVDVKKTKRDAPNTNTVKPVTTPERAPAAPTQEKEAISKHEPVVVEDNVPFRIRIPSTLKSEWSTFKAEMGSAIGGVSLDDANLGRPILEIILLEYREQILEQAEALKGNMKRPANTDRVAMAEFDEAIGQVISKALKQRRRKS